SGKLDFFENQEGQVKPYFVLRGKALEESSKELIELMKEILGHTVFDDRKEILKITQRLISNFEQAINFRAHTLAASRAVSHVKIAARLQELSGGIDQFNYLKSVREELREEDSDTLSEQLADTMQKLFSKK